MDVAVVAMGVMQTAIDQIIRVVAVWHGLMATSLSMLVTLAFVCRGAGGRIFLACCNHVFVHVVSVHVMEMAVVQVVDVVPVLDGHMTTVGPVLMVMAGVFSASAHTSPFRLSLPLAARCLSFCGVIDVCGNLRG
jgi:hypothetical protein